MIDQDLMFAGALAFAAFTPLAAVDGLYIHLWKLRLHTRPEARGEHALHTARAVLFVPIALLLFALPSGGALLWAGAAFALGDTVVELWDVFAHTAHRDHPDRRVVITSIAHRDRESERSDEQAVQMLA